MKNILERAGESLLRRVLPADTASACTRYQILTHSCNSSGICKITDGACGDIGCAYFQNGVYYPSWAGQSPNWNFCGWS